MSPPVTHDASWSEDSCAACPPSSGLPPVPVHHSHNSGVVCMWCLLKGASRHMSVGLKISCIPTCPFLSAVPSLSLASHLSVAANLQGPFAPSPRVSSEPICTLLAACDCSKACASVFTAQNSTPCCTSSFSLSCMYTQRPSCRSLCTCYITTQKGHGSAASRWNCQKPYHYEYNMYPRVQSSKARLAGLSYAAG